jgi:SAM-dependent methyltransferase
MDNKGKDIALTNSEFWDEEWSQINLPCRVNTNGYMYYCQDRLFKEKLKPGNKRFLEVGCAPGRYMIYFAEHFGYTVLGIDHSKIGCIITRKNLELTGISGTVIQGDFLDHSLPLKEDSFDAVFSAGFIEHFSDPMPVLSRMVTLLKPGGLLLVTIPSFAGFGGVIRRLADPEIYVVHNPLTANDLVTAYKRLGLKDIDVWYFASFRLSVLKQSSSSWWKTVLWFTARSIDKVLTCFYRTSKISLEGRWLSSQIYAYGVKPRSKQGTGI